MKKTLVLMIVLCTMLLTGCAKVTDLSEYESDVLTEYMSGYILNHADEYDRRLLPIDELEEKVIDVNEDSLVIESKKTSDRKEEQRDVSTDNNHVNNEIKVETVSLDKTMNFSNFSIDYDRYELHSSYPLNKEEAYFSLNASKNEQLVVVYFDVKNLSNETKRFDLVEEGITYTLEVQNDKSYAPMMTLLMNDIQYINTDIGANNTLSTVIVFKVKDTIDVTNAKLNISRKGNSTLIDLK